MDVEQFWDLIQTSEGDGKRLATLLLDLKPEEIRGFGDFIDLHFNKAYMWKLWAAAYLINGGCSEEEFDQFVYWLIGKGKETYNRTLENPDYLAEKVAEDEVTFNEDIIISIARALDRLDKSIDGRSNITIPADLAQYEEKPKNPRGKEWQNDGELLEMFPKLGERFGEMLEWEEEEEEEEWDEDEGKNKLRRVWDKLVGFFANIVDKFLKLFRKKGKEEEQEEEKEEFAANRISTKLKINFWFYIGFMVLFLGFVALIPLTVMFQHQIEKKIFLLTEIQANTSYLQSISFTWDYFTGIIIDRYITKLETRIDKWENLQYLWVISMITCFIAGISFLKLLLQPRHVELTPEALEFLNKKEIVKQRINLNEIESVQMSRSNSIQIRLKKDSAMDPKLMLDMADLKPLKKFCQMQKITTDEESNLGKMLIYQISYKIRQLKNKK
ncbi:MAG: DUF4240 domain-containing protein [Candidatus Lokiarchaeota archaeon]|nr:DUF4240 domain-containing protein [Candidatus Lokiarchaeota archaeon]